MEKVTPSFEIPDDDIIVRKSCLLSSSFIGLIQVDEQIKTLYFLR